MRTGSNTNTNEKYEEQNPCEESHNSITKAEEEDKIKGSMTQRKRREED
jgi:hypothetical protein